MRADNSAIGNAASRVVPFRDNGHDVNHYSMAISHTARTLIELFDALVEEEKGSLDATTFDVSIRRQNIRRLTKQTADLLDFLSSSQPRNGTSGLTTCRYREILLRMPALIAAYQGSEGLICVTTVSATVEWLPCLSAEFSAALLAIIRGQLGVSTATSVELRADDLPGSSSEVRIALIFVGGDCSALSYPDHSGLRFVQYFAISGGGTYRFTVNENETMHELIFPAHRVDHGK